MQLGCEIQCIQHAYAAGSLFSDRGSCLFRPYCWVNVNNSLPSTFSRLFQKVTVNFYSIYLFRSNLLLACSMAKKNIVWRCRKWLFKFFEIRFRLIKGRERERGRGRYLKWRSGWWKCLMTNWWFKLESKKTRKVHHCLMSMTPWP